jgi:hypothetical protein
MKKFDKISMVKLMDDELKKVVGGTTDDVAIPLYGIVKPAPITPKPLYGIIKPLYEVVALYGIIIPAE